MTERSVICCTCQHIAVCGSKVSIRTFLPDEKKSGHRSLHTTDLQIMSKRAADKEIDERVTAPRHEGEDAPKAGAGEEYDAEMGEFEDPYGDDFESEEEIFEAGDDVENEEDPDAKLEAIGEEAEMEEDGVDSTTTTKQSKTTPGVFLPNRGTLGPDEVMEADPTTYHMLHSINVQWPCLSFDILEDNLGSERQGYPQTAYIVTGTQAKRAKDNEIMVMKFSSLSKTLVRDDSESESDDDDVDDESDPVLETKSLPTRETTNRIRVSPHARQTGEYLTASMSEGGDVYVWDVTPHFKSFDTPGTVISKQMNRPVHTISVHGNVEGYAVDWSPAIPTGALLTGDISGRIHLTTRTQSGWTTDRTPFEGTQGSVEEIQWSAVERSVFASGGSDGMIRIWDTRKKKHQPALSVKATDTDINVMSWNKKADYSYLLASGHDDGSWGVWDLRSFKASTVPSPVASFAFHRKPITSVEFHPSDASVVAVASEDSFVTLWDLSVEADDEEIRAQNRDANGELDEVPSQLLFAHWQRNAKEVHWHPQVPGMLISTGSDGFSLFKTISV